MAVIFSKPKNRLAWRAGRKGVSRSEAVVQADTNIESIRDEGLAYIDANLEHLNVLLHQVCASAPPIAKFYDASSAVADTAGVFGFAPLGRAAHSLCELLSQFEQSGAWKLAPVKVHIAALSILRRTPAGQGDAETDKLLADLSVLLEHVTQGA